MEAVHRGRAIAAGIGAGVQVIAPHDRHPAQRAFGRQVIDLNSTVAAVIDERGAAVQGVLNRFAGIGFPRQRQKHRFEPLLQAVEQRNRMGLSDSTTLVRRFCRGSAPRPARARFGQRTNGSAFSIGRDCLSDQAPANTDMLSLIFCLICLFDGGVSSPSEVPLYWRIGSRPLHCAAVPSRRKSGSRRCHSMPRVFCISIRIADYQAKILRLAQETVLPTRVSSYGSQA